MVIRVRWQTIGQIDAAAIKDLAITRHGDKYRRVAVLGDSDNGSSSASSFQAGIFARNLRARAASIVSHLSSRRVLVRMYRSQAGGRTVKSIGWRPQSGRRPS